MLFVHSSRKILCSGLMAFALGLMLGSPPAPAADAQFQSLPAEAKTYAEDVRKLCKDDVGQEGVPADPMAGISEVSLSDGTPALILDNETLCTDHYSGTNCTNRGCDLVILAKQGRIWKETFKEHLYDKKLSVGNDGKLQLITATIYAGDPHCRPPHGAKFQSSDSCDVLIRYKDKSWHWEKVE
jgi:hypothetical protein